MISLAHIRFQYSHIQKFEQRIIPAHSSRSFNTRNNLTFRPSNNFFHYYEFNFPPESETNTMKTLVRNPEDLNLLSRLNQHDRLAGTLGILPNHLIQLVRSSDSKNVKKILDDLRLTTFGQHTIFGLSIKHLTERFGKSFRNAVKLRRNINFTISLWRKIWNPLKEHAVAVFCWHAVAKKTRIFQIHCWISIIRNLILNWRISHWTLLTIKITYYRISLVLITSILRKIE